MPVPAYLASRRSSKRRTHLRHGFLFASRAIREGEIIPILRNAIEENS
jgi:hypothetical protein